MNILYIISSLNIGGAEVLVTDVCKYHKYNFKIYVIVNKDGVLGKKLKESNFYYYVFPKKGIDLLYIIRLRKFIKQKKINIVHVHDRTNALNVFLAIFYLRVKTVYTVHGCGKSFLKYLVILLSHKVIFVSETVQNKILKKTDKKHLVVYNGIDSKKFFKKNKNKLFHGALTSDVPLLGMVGNFKNPARNQITICKALKLLHDKGLDFKFDFIGEKSVRYPEYFDSCYNYCNEYKLLGKINFLGLKTNINEIINNLDLFIYSSLNETFCLSVVEAMMSGVPVIVNDLDVFMEITENGKYATLYKTKDPEDLASKIEHFVRNPQSYQHKAEKASAYARSKFSIEEHYKNLVTVYNEVMKS